MIILASASPRRRELMGLITDDFQAVAVNADETFTEDTDVMKVAEHLAEKKAKGAHANYGDVVIGCDTVVICDGKILGKPHNPDEARSFMKMLSGRTHVVTTGCCIICGTEKISFTETTEVTFRKLSEEETEDYVHSAEPYDKAGGYGIQGRGALLVEKINGDYYNVVGLPVSRLNQELKKFIYPF